MPLADLSGQPLPPIGTRIGFIRANALDHTLAAAAPAVPLDETNAVSANLFLGNVILISGCAIGTVVRRVLICLAGTQGLSTLVDVE